MRSVQRGQIIEATNGGKSAIEVVCRINIVIGSVTLALFLVLLVYFSGRTFIGELDDIIVNSRSISSNLTGTLILIRSAHFPQSANGAAFGLSLSGGVIVRSVKRGQLIEKLLLLLLVSLTVVLWWLQRQSIAYCQWEWCQSLNANQTD